MKNMQKKRRRYYFIGFLCLLALTQTYCKKFVEARKGYITKETFEIYIADDKPLSTMRVAATIPYLTEVSVSTASVTANDRLYYLVKHKDTIGWAESRFLGYRSKSPHFDPLPWPKEIFEFSIDRAEAFKIALAYWRQKPNHVQRNGSTAEFTEYHTSSAFISSVNGNICAGGKKTPAKLIVVAFQGSRYQPDFQYFVLKFENGHMINHVPTNCPGYNLPFNLDKTLEALRNPESMVECDYAG